MTVHKCQAVAAAGGWRNPKVKLMAIIVTSVSIDLPLCTGRTNVMVPLVGFHDRGPDDDDKRDKQKRFDDHRFVPSAIRSIEDRPATVVNKIRAST
jgi:hypothetical protein